MKPLYIEINKETNLIASDEETSSIFLSEKRYFSMEYYPQQVFVSDLVFDDYINAHRLTIKTENIFIDKDLTIPLILSEENGQKYAYII